MEQWEIRVVGPEVVMPVRHQVMWPDKPLSFVHVDGDEQALHLALFVEEQPVSVVSVFREDDGWQFRKLATLPAFQKKGCAGRLLNEVFRLAAQAGVVRIWCNARKEKCGFYRRFGLQSTGEGFVREGKEYIIMETSAPLYRQQ